ncbi:MAG: branched-chain amino acid ABC transporter permease [Candidatus Tectomicrobia bacterium]|nr:branched-chain amino acid ABC transporter permease [Candidatus Tectomicrobia bacterium]
MSKERMVWGVSLASFIVFWLLIPKMTTPYILSIMLNIALSIALAGSWNIISGFTGYVSFGHVAFYGVGAYTAAILITRFGWHWFPTSLLGGGTAIALSLLIGYPCLRLKGPYFAIAMLGLSETVRIIAQVWASLTGGGSGLSLPPVRDIIPTYYVMGFSALAVVMITSLLANSKFGLKLMAIREDETAAETMGIHTTRCKLLAFMLSAFFPGVVGGFHAWHLSYIDPITVFDVLKTIQMIIMTMFGGAGTVLGPVIGAVFLNLLSEVLWARFAFAHQAIYGALIVVVVIFMPGGVISLLRDYKLIPMTRKI